MIAADFFDWLKRSRRGAKLVYHRGCLMADRIPLHAVKLDTLATAVWRAYAAGDVTLYQKRVANGCDYYVEKRAV